MGMEASRWDTAHSQLVAAAKPKILENPSEDNFRQIHKRKNYFGVTMDILLQCFSFHKIHIVCNKT